MSTLKRLLKHPHRAVFDKSPDAGVAFLLHRDGGLSWSVFDGQMTVTTPARTYSYTLASYTIGSLINRLKVDGFDPVQPSFAFFGRSALILVEGEGDTNNSNGDQVMAFRSMLWALYSAYAPELRIAKEQVVQAIRQMIIWQSEGEWTDVWGNLFGISRDDAELDPRYAARIPKEAFRLRVNKYAIEMAIRELTGRKVFIQETWPDMFRLDESRLSGTSRFPSADQYRYGYIQPFARELFDWTGVLEVIERNKAAGVIVLPPLVQISELVQGRLDGTTMMGILAAYGALVKTNDDVRLDWMELGNAFPSRNWRVRIYDQWAFHNDLPLDGTIWAGMSEEQPARSLLYGTPDFHPLTPIRTDELTPIGVNFNNWSRGRKWSDGDTWANRGGSVPRRAQGKMESETESLPFVVASNEFHAFVHNTLPGNVSE
jgi:hypothetical protein